MDGPNWRGLGAGDMVARGRYIHGLVARGWTLDEIARHLSELAVREEHPDLPDEEVRRRAARKPYAFSRGNVGFYSLAWRVCGEAALSPEDPEVFVAAYRLCMRASAAVREPLVRESRDLPSDARRRAFLVRADALFRGRRA